MNFKKIKNYVGLATIAGTMAVSSLSAQNNVEPDSVKTKEYTICLPGAVKTTTTPTEDTVYVVNQGDKFIHTTEGTYKIETEIVKDNVTIPEAEENDYITAYTDPLNNEITEKDSTISALRKLNNYFANGALTLNAGLSGTWNDFSPIGGIGYDFWIPVAQDNDRLNFYLGVNGYINAPNTESVETTSPVLVNEVVNDMPGTGMHRVGEFWESDITTTKQTQLGDLMFKGEFPVGDYNLFLGAGVSISKVETPVTTESFKLNYLVDNATGNRIPTGNAVALEPVTTPNTNWFVPTGMALEAMIGKEGSKLSVGVYTSNQTFGLNDNNGLSHSGFLVGYTFK